MFDLPARRGNSKPVWVTNGSATQEKLYDLVVQEVASVETKLKSSEELSKKERHIVKSQIAAKAGLNASYITKRELPDLVEFIDEQNQKLTLLWEQKGHTNVKRLTNLNRQEMLSEIKALQAENERLKQMAWAEQCEVLLSSQMLESQKKLHERLADTLAENESLLEKNARLKQQNRELDELLSQVQEKYTKLLQQKGSIRSVK